MIYDLIVIGGGPAGVMAAGRSAELGSKVLLLEKNKSLGIKLLITGNGRCNLTNIVSIKEMTKSFGENGKFLFSALTKFSSENVINFFSERGLETKVEDNNRVFPVTDKSLDVLKVLSNYLKENDVEILLNTKVKDIQRDGNRISSLTLSNGKKLFAKNYLIATGGLSFPGTGSTGDGYIFLKSLGHKIIKTYPSLSPVRIKDKRIKDLEGISLVDAKFIWKKENKIIDSKIGEAIFTSDGLSGPAIFLSSAIISKNLPGIDLEIDLMPNKDLLALDLLLQKKFFENKNKNIKNVLSALFPARLTLMLLEIVNISAGQSVNSITKDQRKKICRVIKKLDFEIASVVGYERAMLTTGGLDLKEVDSKSMKSKLIENLFIAGEVLDLDGPTGGYNLQSCWSTGYLAGESLINI